MREYFRFQEDSSDRLCFLWSWKRSLLCTRCTLFPRSWSRVHTQSMRPLLWRGALGMGIVHMLRWEWCIGSLGMTMMLLKEWMP